MSDPFAAIAALGVAPVIAIEDAGDSVALADALLEGGLKVAEITFRAAAAAQTLTALKDARPELLIGAGAWAAPTEDIRERRFADIAKKARAAVMRVAEIRTRAK